MRFPTFFSSIFSSIPIKGIDGQVVGEVTQYPNEIQAMLDRGWIKCETPGCHFYASPQGVAWAVEYQGGDYTCPNCGRTQRLMMGWEPEDPKIANAGMHLSQFGKMGEAAIYHASETPEWHEKYGNIAWWQEGIDDLVSGGGLDHGKLDGISINGEGTVFGIEVKSANSDGTDQRFNIDNVQRDGKHDYAANFATYEPELAQQLGVMQRPKVQKTVRDWKKGQPKYVEPSGEVSSHGYDQGNNDIDMLLAVLPIFDFNENEVSIYVKECPLSGHRGAGNRKNTIYNGFVSFPPRGWRDRGEEYRTQYLLIDKVKFQNPYGDPQNNQTLVVKPVQSFNFQQPTDAELTFSEAVPDPGPNPNEEMPF